MLAVERQIILNRFSLCILFVFISYYLQSQDSIEKHKNQVGISSNININFLSSIQGHNKIVFIVIPGGMQKVNVIPGVKRAYNLNITYHRYLSEKFKLLTGFGYSEYSISSQLSPFETYWKEKLKTITVPILLRKVFKRDLFLDFGPIIEFDLKESYHPFTDVQDGFGLELAGGKNLELINSQLRFTQTWNIIRFCH